MNVDQIAQYLGRSFRGLSRDRNFQRYAKHGIPLSSVANGTSIHTGEDVTQVHTEKLHRHPFLLCVYFDFFAVSFSLFLSIIFFFLFKKQKEVVDFI